MSRRGIRDSHGLSAGPRGYLDQLWARRELRLVERSSDSHGGERKRNGKAVKISFN